MYIARTKKVQVAEEPVPLRARGPGRRRLQPHPLVFGQGRARVKQVCSIVYYGIV